MIKYRLISTLLRSVYCGLRLNIFQAAQWNPILILQFMGVTPLRPLGLSYSFGVRHIAQISEKKARLISQSEDMSESGGQRTIMLDPVPTSDPNEPLVSI